MGQLKFARRYLIGACAAAIAISPLSAAMAQIGVAQIQDNDVTTVSPVTVTGLAPIPKVGAGAPFFSPDEIAKTRDAAALEGRGARYFVEDLSLGKAPKTENFAGDFGLELLCRTEAARDADLVAASDAADKATQDALAARGAMARGEGSQGTVDSTELARQIAVNAYIDARSEALEADNRVYDLRTLPQVNNASRETLPSDVERRTEERKMAGGILTAEEFSDLKVSGVTAHARGGGVLRVTGRIVNTRRTSIAIPPLAASILDDTGYPLKSQQVVAKKAGRIPPGGSYPFSFDVKPIPARATEAVVTFATTRRPSVIRSTGCFK